MKHMPIDITGASKFQIEGGMCKFFIYSATGGFFFIHFLYGCSFVCQKKGDNFLV